MGRVEAAARRVQVQVMLRAVMLGGKEAFECQRPARTHRTMHATLRYEEGGLLTWMVGQGRHLGLARAQL